MLGMSKAQNVTRSKRRLGESKFLLEWPPPTHPLLVLSQLLLCLYELLFLGRQLRSKASDIELLQSSKLHSKASDIELLQSSKLRSKASDIKLLQSSKLRSKASDIELLQSSKLRSKAMRNLKGCSLGSCTARQCIV